MFFLGYRYLNFVLVLHIFASMGSNTRNVKINENVAFSKVTCCLIQVAKKKKCVASDLNSYFLLEILRKKCHRGWNFYLYVWGTYLDWSEAKWTGYPQVGKKRLDKILTPYEYCSRCWSWSCQQNLSRIVGSRSNQIWFCGLLCLCWLTLNWDILPPLPYPFYQLF